jgi:hypothetical protein
MSILTNFKPIGSQRWFSQVFLLKLNYFQQNDFIYLLQKRPKIVKITRKPNNNAKGLNNNAREPNNNAKRIK